MRDKITADSLANEIRMTHNHPTGQDRVFLLVEGEGDQKLFRKFFHRETVYIRCSQKGKLGIHELLAKLSQEKTADRVIGIRDADFARLLPEVIPPQVFLTDMHDLEMMMLHADHAFQAVICEHHEGLSLSELEDLRQHVLDSLYPIGLLKFVNEKEKKELNFRAVSLQKYISPGVSGHMTICVPDYINELIAKSPSANHPETLANALQESASYPPTEICNGHDCFAVLAVYFQKKGVAAKKNQDLESAMRVAYSADDFQQTTLFKQLRDWADTTGYRLF